MNVNTPRFLKDMPLTMTPKPKSNRRPPGDEGPAEIAGERLSALRFRVDCYHFPGNNLLN
jgi:hypothetical protein